MLLGVFIFLMGPTREIERKRTQKKWSVRWWLSLQREGIYLCHIDRLLMRSISSWENESRIMKFQHFGNAATSQSLILMALSCPFLLSSLSLSTGVWYKDTKKAPRFLFITFKFKTVRDLFMLVRGGVREVESKAHKKESLEPLCCCCCCCCVWRWWW